MTVPPLGLDERQLAVAASDLRAALVARGVGAGDRVALWSGTFPEHVAARDAIAALEAWVVPINPRLALEEISHIVSAARATALVVGRTAEGEPASVLGAAHAHFGDRLAVVDLPALAPASATAGALPSGYGGAVVFTSGTTGYPKGCVRPVAREAARGAELISTYALSATDVQLIACPLAHSAPGIFVRAARAVGAATWLLPRFRPEDFLRAIEETGTTFSFVVPTQCERLLASAERAPAKLSSLRALIVAGAPLARATKERLIAWLGPNRLWEFYGSTETGTIAVLPPVDQLSHPGAVGTPPPGVLVRVRPLVGAGDAGECARGEVGELFVASPTVMLGYDGHGERNDDGSRFVSVGDIGFVDADGYVHLVDRKYDTIISGGANVYPAEVERALMACRGIRGAVVFGLEDPAWGQIVAAVVAVDPEDARTTEQVLDELRRHLAGYKLPRAWASAAFDELPVGSSGKPLRRRARTQFAARVRRIDDQRR